MIATFVATPKCTRLNFWKLFDNMDDALNYCESCVGTRPDLSPWMKQDVIRDGYSTCTFAANRVYIIDLIIYKQKYDKNTTHTDLIDAVLPLLRSETLDDILD